MVQQSTEITWLKFGAEKDEEDLFIKIDLLKLIVAYDFTYVRVAKTCCDK